MTKLLPFAILALLAASGARAQATAPRFDHAIAYAAKANVIEALARFDRFPDSELTAAQRLARECITSRFRSDPAQFAGDASLPPFASQALSAYRRYWTAVLLRRAQPDAAERELSEALGALVSPKATTLDDRIEALQRRLEEAGLHAYTGHKAPMRELMIWRNQASNRETVALPEGPVQIDVVLLDDFASLGWPAWATCDLRYSAAWAIDGGTMVVARAWQRSTESYDVSLIAHEAQHVRDHRRYPKLSQPDLEFRAKLVELALGSQSHPRLLGVMTTESRNLRSLPHPFANYWVVRRLRDRLGTRELASAGAERIRLAALDELRRHSEDLDRLGPEGVVTALPD